MRKRTTRFNWLILALGFCLVFFLTSSEYFHLETQFSQDNTCPICNFHKSVNFHHITIADCTQPIILHSFDVQINNIQEPIKDFHLYYSTAQRAPPVTIL